MRSLLEESWSNIYSLTKNTQHYYPTVSGGKWITMTGDETVSINSGSYTRYVVIDNVSRNDSTRNIETTYVSANDDPSTQKITATVVSPSGVSVVIPEYFYRWKNKICTQTAWVTGGSGNTVKTCPDTTYDTKDASIDVSSGTSIVITGGQISGTLTSSVFDTTASSSTVGYNSIMWKGTFGGAGQNEGKVLFQLAGSASATGPWNFYGGSTCGALDFFDSTGPNVPIELKGASCFSAWNNMRYFRYKVKVCSNNCVASGANSPTINDVMINWSP